MKPPAKKTCHLLDDLPFQAVLFDERQDKLLRVLTNMDWEGGRVS